MSPLIGGRAVKGPADRMLQRLAGGTAPRRVASCYPGLIDVLVVDEAEAGDLDGLGDVRPIVTRTLMSDDDARRRLAEVALEAGSVVGKAAAARPEELKAGSVVGKADAARPEDQGAVRA